MKNWVFVTIAFVQFAFAIGQHKKNKNNSKKTTIAPVFVVPAVDPGEIDDQSPEFHKTPYELSKFTKTATYDEAVNWYKKLHRSFPNTELLNIGNSDAKRKSDSAFAKDGGAQLDFVYKNSEYYEPSHRRYPVYRIMR